MVTFVSGLTNIGTAATATINQTTGSFQAGDRCVIAVLGKYQGTTVPTLDQGYTLVRSGTGGAGVAGNDTGTMFYAVYAKDMASSSDANPTMTAGVSPANSWIARSAIWRPSAGASWRDSITNPASWVGGASDTNTASPISGTVTVAQVSAGDAICAMAAIPTDTGTGAAADTMTVSGISGGTKPTNGIYTENTMGTDMALHYNDWTDFTGTAADTNLGYSVTIPGASNHSGIVVGYVIREVAPPAGPPRNIYTSNPALARSYQW